MTKSTVFKTNRTQAIRIPKDLAFPESIKEVEIKRQGDGLLILPRPNFKSWKDWFENGPRVTDDFMSERDQGEPDRREPL